MIYHKLLPNLWYINQKFGLKLSLVFMRLLKSENLIGVILLDRPFSVVSMEFENDTQHIMHIILQTVVSLFGNRLENDCFSNNLILSVNGNFPNI